MQVHRAICKPLGEVVAVKVVNLEGVGAQLAALTKEAALMRRFHHPNILQLHASFVNAHELWMVMPFLGAGSVRCIMRERFPAVSGGRSQPCGHARQQRWHLSLEPPANAAGRQRVRRPPEAAGAPHARRPRCRPPHPLQRRSHPRGSAPHSLRSLGEPPAANVKKNGQRAAKAAI
jgi:hypothetical protein